MKSFLVAVIFVACVAAVPIEQEENLQGEHSHVTPVAVPVQGRQINTNPGFQITLPQFNVPTPPVGSFCVSNAQPGQFFPQSNQLSLYYLGKPASAYSALAASPALHSNFIGKQFTYPYSFDKYPSAPLFHPNIPQVPNYPIYNYPQLNFPQTTNSTTTPTYPTPTYPSPTYPTPTYPSYPGKYFYV